MQRWLRSRSRISPSVGWVSSQSESSGQSCGIGRVVEAQALVGPEDGDRRVELVERRGMRLDVAVEFLLGVLERRHVDGEACGAVGHRHLEDVERAHRRRR